MRRRVSPRVKGKCIWRQPINLGSVLWIMMPRVMESNTPLYIWAAWEIVPEADYSKRSNANPYYRVVICFLISYNQGIAILDLTSRGSE
ncbi:hypothetical protein L1987_04571 [Smallanthus sonchifolius]|uniref:Uncharacterized protein n=1 Tax=Smallanthus sonchifolius TaxID=185202 RepID=A0ACB9JSY5_9ASTR|nr:hypothetical protein L1987_04571 [Smallanthus sonchifolius]